MVWRSVAGGILGFVLWWLLFFAFGVGIGLLWPDYRDAARVMAQEGDFRLFTLPMLLANLLVFAVAGIVAGSLTTRLAKSRRSALVLAALLLVYAIIEHYILLWDQLPHWYNVIVPVVIAGFIWVGSRITMFGAGGSEGGVRASAQRTR
jgi:hypothetical protein